MLLPPLRYAAIDATLRPYAAFSAIRYVAATPDMPRDDAHADMIGRRCLRCYDMLRHAAIAYTLLRFTMLLMLFDAIRVYFFMLIRLRRCYAMLAATLMPPFCRCQRQLARRHMPRAVVFAIFMTLR